MRKLGLPFTVRVRRTKYGIDKQCVICRLFFPMEDCFSKQSTGRLGYDNRCKLCKNDQQNAYRACQRDGAWYGIDRRKRRGQRVSP